MTRASAASASGPPWPDAEAAEALVIGNCSETSVAAVRTTEVVVELGVRVILRINQRP